MKLIKIFLLVAGLFSTTVMADTVFKKGDTAIKGFDTVAYHTMSKAVKGDSQYVHHWKGTNWIFSTSANRDLFSANPEKYAPEYGGYCAFAASKGSLAPTDPYAWTVHNDKLYLNYSKEIRSKWKKDIPGNIKKADANWPELSSQ